MHKASHSPQANAGHGYLQSIWGALGGHPSALQNTQLVSDGDLPSVFAVTDLAAASIAAAGLALAELLDVRYGRFAPVQVDRRLASFWFSSSLRPVGWKAPSAWDSIAGDYAASDGWIRLHTNAPHHRTAALTVLGCTANKDSVAHSVAGWTAQELESAIIEQGGCAAQMRSQAEWATHPQGKAVSLEPLLWRAAAAPAAAPSWAIPPQRPLQGIRVLDLTRIIAGPVATRFLAGYGADVLRIDPLNWDEPAVAAELTVGKRCARLDLRSTEGRRVFRQLLRDTDVLVHGYRADALVRQGFDPEQRRRINPGLIDVSLNAYGWTGPWNNRRGFDSLVQMSTGIADTGMRLLDPSRPTPLPVQALDHATGYMMAAAVIRALSERLKTGAGSDTRASLARTAALLVQGLAPQKQMVLAPEARDDRSAPNEMTAWGRARRLKAPLDVAGTPLRWDRPAGLLGSAPASW